MPHQNIFRCRTIIPSARWVVGLRTGNAPIHNRRGGVPAAPEKIQNSTADSPRLQPPQTYGHPPQHLFRTEFLSPDFIVLEHGDDVHVADDTDVSSPALAVQNCLDVHKMLSRKIQ